MKLFQHLAIALLAKVGYVSGLTAPCPKEPENLGPEHHQAFCHCWNETNDIGDSSPFSNYFVVHNSNKNFDDSIRECNRTGMTLAKISTQLEVRLLQCIIKDSTILNNVWIGLRTESPYRDVKSLYRWLDRTEDTVSNWGEKQPDNNSLSNGADKCVVVAKRFNSFNHWDNDVCTRPESYACYKELTIYQMILSPDQPKTVTITVAESKSIAYLPNMTVETTFGDAKLLGLASNSSFHLNLRSLVLEGDISTLIHKSTPYDLSTRKQTTVGNLLDITVPENVTVQLNYTININENTVKGLFTALDYGSGDERVVMQSATVECHYIDPISARYLSIGMETTQTPNGFVCSSNHTTIFAALLSVEVVLIPHSAQILTYVTEAISVLSLITTLTILIRLKKKLKNDRTVVQINLCAALLLLHVASLLHDTALKFSHFCEVIAVTIHLSLLSSAFWMLLEGISLMTKISDRALRSVDARKVRWLRVGIGWFLPTAIVASSAVPGFMFDTYMPRKSALLANVTQVPEYRKCWLNVDQKHIGSLLSTVVPAAITIAINSVILLRVGVFVYRKSKNARKLKRVPRAIQVVPTIDTSHVKAALRAVIMLLPALSLPWIFFIVASTNVVFVYISILINGLQGFFLFLVYCVFSEEVRTNWTTVWKRSLFGKCCHLAEENGAPNNIEMTKRASSMSH